MVGALLLMAGLVVVGTGFVLTSEAEHSEFSCLGSQAPSCGSTILNAENETELGLGLLGAGSIVAGAGAAIGFSVMISIMARRETVQRPDAQLPAPAVAPLPAPGASPPSGPPSPPLPPT